jgi:hypothetical protein
MKTLNALEFSHWCHGHGIELDERRWLKFRAEAKLTFLVKLPKGPPYKAVALARECFPFSEGKPFAGAVVYFREWGIWNNLDEETGMCAVLRLRASYGEKRGLSETPAHVFSEKEFPDARAFWTLPVILGWDAFLIPENPDYFVFNSHDEVVSFICRTKERYEQLLDAFKDWDLEKGDWYFH